eukprot:gene7556-7765_t
MKPSSGGLGTQRARPVVLVRSAGDDVGKDFLNIFSKPKVADIKFPENDFKGKVTHHGAKKPFTDGLGAGKTLPKSSTAAEDAQDEEAQNEVAQYVGEALENVVSSNFDPEQPQATTGSAGWQGDIHDRKRDGFHARKV